MPKVTIEFNTPEEAPELHDHMHGQHYCVALCNIDNHLRACLKHGHSYKDVEEALEGVREMIPHEIWENS